MKKIKLLLLTLVLSVSSAYAEESFLPKVQWMSAGIEMGSGEYVSGSVKDKKLSQQSVSWTLGFKNNYTLEFRNVTSQMDQQSDGKYGNPLSYQEIGLGKSFDVGLTKVFGKVFINQYEKPTKRYMGHAYEIGIRDKIGSTNFDYSVSYTKLDSFQNSDLNTADNSKYKYSIGYTIDKNHKVYARYQRQRGIGLEFDSMHYGYNYRF